MRITVLILTVLVFTGVFYKLSAQKKNTGNRGNSPSANGLHDTKTHETSLVDNPYEDLKSRAYAFKYNGLDLPDPGEREVIYAALMDWDDEEGTFITLVSFITGDASIYISTGGGIIGGSQNAEVNKTSKAFIEKAAALLPKASNIDTALISEKGYLKFYLLTNKGKYTVKDKLENVYNQTSHLSDAFAVADTLFTQMRLTTKKHTGKKWQLILQKNNCQIIPV